MGVHCEGMEGASAKPPPRLRRGETSLQRKRPAPRENDFSRCWSVAPIWRDNVQVVGKAAWGRVCGRAKLLRRDAALPATKAAGLSAFSIIGLTVQQLGRCPKPHQRCRLWTPQGADEKGRSPPLDPFRAIELVSLPYSFRVLRFGVPKQSALTALPIP